MTSGLCGSSLRLFEGYLTEENSLSAFSEVMDYWTFGMSKIPLFKSWGPPSKGGPPSEVIFFPSLPHLPYLFSLTLLHPHMMRGYPAYNPRKMCEMH